MTMKGQSAITLAHALQKQTEAAPSKEALVQGERRVTYGALWAEARRFAQALLREPWMARGVRCALLVDNGPEYVAAFYGIWLAGGVAVPLNSGNKPSELCKLMEHCDARLLVLGGRPPAFMAELLGNLPAQVKIVWGLRSAATATQHGKAVTAWSDFVREVVEDGAEQPLPELSPEDRAMIIYTSGTTGDAKGVTLRHRNILANTLSIIEYLGITSEDRCLNVLPFFYSYGNSVLHTHLGAGATLILEPGLVFPHKVMERMAAEKVTSFPGVPASYALLMKRVDFSKYDLSSLRYMTQAGAPMPAAQVERMKGALPHVKFFVMYGQTEASARLSYLPPEDLERKLGGVGIPIPGVKLEIRNEADAPVGANVVGEVCAHGDNLMEGYWNDPEGTAAVLKNGWLHTRDVGRIDEDGFLFLEGRASDLIKSGGHRISPLEIEQVIARLDGVGQVAVVGIPDDMMGQAIKAVIVRAAESSLTEREIQNHCLQHLSSVKVPRVVAFVEELPTTSTGKVRRHLLV